MVELLHRKEEAGSDCAAIHVVTTLDQDPGGAVLSEDSAVQALFDYCCVVQRRTAAISDGYGGLDKGRGLAGLLGVTTSFDSLELYELFGLNDIAVINAQINDRRKRQVVRMCNPVFD